MKELPMDSTGRLLLKCPECDKDYTGPFCYDVYTLEQIRQAWYDYHKKQKIRPSYILETWKEFELHLTQGE